MFQKYGSTEIADRAGEIEDNPLVSETSNLPPSPKLDHGRSENLMIEESPPEIIRASSLENSPRVDKSVNKVKVPFTSFAGNQVPTNSLLHPLPDH
jgi:hypothetical protein